VRKHEKNNTTNVIHAFVLSNQGTTLDDTVLYGIQFSSIKT